MTPPTDGFARRLRSALDESGLSAREAARRCTRAGAQVSAPTLRSWAMDGSRPSRRASFEVVDVLERVLGTEPGWFSTPLRAAERLAGTEDGMHSDLLTELERFGARCGLSGAALLHRDLISTTLDLDQRASALLRHRVLATALAPGVEGLLSVVHGRGLEPAELTAQGGEIMTTAQVETDLLAVAIRLPRPLASGEPVLVDLVAPVPADQGAPERIATLSPWPAALIVAALRAEDRVYHGRAVRTDLDGPQERIRAREVDLLPGATGMQCVSRDVQAAEVAVEWRPGPPAA